MSSHSPTAHERRFGRLQGLVPFAGRWPGIRIGVAGHEAAPKQLA